MPARRPLSVGQPVAASAVQQTVARAQTHAAAVFLYRSRLPPPPPPTPQPLPRRRRRTADRPVSPRRRRRRHRMHRRRRPGRESPFRSTATGGTQDRLDVQASRRLCSGNLVQPTRRQHPSGPWWRRLGDFFFYYFTRATVIIIIIISGAVPTCPG